MLLVFSERQGAFILIPSPQIQAQQLAAKRREFGGFAVLLFPTAWVAGVGVERRVLALFPAFDALASRVFVVARRDSL
jgi:hypothetical protein